MIKYIIKDKSNQLPPGSTITADSIENPSRELSTGVTRLASLQGLASSGSRLPVGRSKVACVGSRVGSIEQHEDAAPTRKHAGCDPSTTLLDYRITQGENNSYSFKYVKSGKIIEIYKYKSAQINKEIGRRERRVKSNKPYSDPDNVKLLYKASEQNHLKSKRTLRRTINSNIGKHGNESPKFVTLTFSEDLRDIATANLLFNKFIKRLNYALKKTIKYTVVIQFQDGKRKGKIKGGRGVIHYHVIFYNLPYLPAKRLGEIWKHGFIKINRINHVDNVGAYLTAYMGKDFMDPRFDGKKKHFSSRGLHEPQEIRSSEELTKEQLSIPDDWSPDFEFVYSNEYVGEVTYTAYNGNRKIPTTET